MDQLTNMLTLYLTVLRAGQGTVMLKKNLVNGIGLAQMMGVSNIIAIVGGGRKPKFAANKASNSPFLETRNLLIYTKGGPLG